MHRGTLQNDGSNSVTRGEELLNKLLFLVSLHIKSILVASQNLSWANDVTWTILPMPLLRFWDWEHCSCVAVYAGSESSQLNILICVPNMN